MALDIDKAIAPTPLFRLRSVLDDDPDPDDWKLLDGGEPLMWHRRSRCIFQIAYDPNQIALERRVTVFALFSFLNHHAGRGAKPNVSSLEKLGREAILVFWIMLHDREDVGMDLTNEVVILDRNAAT